MKRFWKSAAAERRGDGWGIALDGRPLKTPARTDLIVPAQALAQAIADEWNGAGDKIDPWAMPLTGLANAAIDRVAPDPAAFAEGLARYAEADLACYRAEGPRELVERQAREWDPLLAWARRRFDVDFVTTGGIAHVDQPKATVERLRQAVLSLDPFRLAALSPLTTVGGSLVAALAVIERALSAEESYAAVTLDERWQEDKWGADADAAKAMAERRRDFLAAARLAELLDA